MSGPKHNRRSSSRTKLDPIDWHELANDAVLNGNMSTLYHRPPTEDPTAYASEEALSEIAKRAKLPSPITPKTETHSGGQTANDGAASETPRRIESCTTSEIKPTVGLDPTVGMDVPIGDASGSVTEIQGYTNVGRPVAYAPGSVTRADGHQGQMLGALVAVDGDATASITRDERSVEREETVAPTVGLEHTVGIQPIEGSIPTVGLEIFDGSNRIIAADNPVADASADVARSYVAPQVQDQSAIAKKPVTHVPTHPDPSAYRLKKQPVAYAPGSVSGLELQPTVGLEPTVGTQPPTRSLSFRPTVGQAPTVGLKPRVPCKCKPIRDVQDALTLAGQVLYRVMYGNPDGASAKICTKGYRQLAAETHLDKDTVRDLIVDLKGKGIVREIGTYDADTRSSKTYEVLSYRSILQLWRDAGLMYVTSGRRPKFCTTDGQLIEFNVNRKTVPTVGLEPTVGIEPRGVPGGHKPTVGLTETAPVGTAPIAPVGLAPTYIEKREVSEQGTTSDVAEVVDGLQRITGSPVDTEAAQRLIANCRSAASDCTVAEILQFAWSKAAICRSGKLDNPVGFLITQVPKHFQGPSFAFFREANRRELEAAQATFTQQQQTLEAQTRELDALEERHTRRVQVAERYRGKQGIDLKLVAEASDADELLRDWASRNLKMGRRYMARYD